MSHDPLNDDFFSDWDFSAPDWLNDLEPKKPAVAPAKSEPLPAPEDDLIAPVQRRDPESEAVPEREYIPRPATRAASQPRSTSRHTTPSRGRNTQSANASWEQARTAHRPGTAGSRGRSRSRRSSLGAPTILLLVLLIGGMVFAAWQLGAIFLNYSRDRSAYRDLADHAISGLAEAEDTTIAVTTPDPDARPEEVTVSEIPFTVDWEYLSSINDDIVGWLYCPGTVINYPVVQSNDHDYYLDHSFDGSSNTSGTLFVDRDSVSGIVQSNLIIYGHNMKDESMFGTFKYYAEESFFEEHPTLYYLTPEQCYRVDLICAHIVEATTENFPGYFASLDDYNTYLSRISSSAFWVNAEAVTTEHQLLTMSTCTSAAGYSDPRLLVQGMMVPIQ